MLGMWRPVELRRRVGFFGYPDCSVSDSREAGSSLVADRSCYVRAVTAPLVTCVFAVA